MVLGCFEGWFDRLLYKVIKLWLETVKVGRSISTWIQRTLSNFCFAASFTHTVIVHPNAVALKEAGSLHYHLRLYSCGQMWLPFWCTTGHTIQATPWDSSHKPSHCIMVSEVVIGYLLMTLNGCTCCYYSELSRYGRPSFWWNFWGSSLNQACRIPLGSWKTRCECFPTLLWYHWNVTKANLFGYCLHQVVKFWLETVKWKGCVTMVTAKRVSNWCPNDWMTALWAWDVRHFLVPLLEEADNLKAKKAWIP